MKENVLTNCEKEGSGAKCRAVRDSIKSISMKLNSPWLYSVDKGFKVIWLSTKCL